MKNLDYVILPVMHLLITSWLGAGLLISKGYLSNESTGYFSGRLDAMMSILFTFQYDRVFLELNETIFAAGIILLSKHAGLLLLIIGVVAAVWNNSYRLWKRITPIQEQIK